MISMFSCLLQVVRVSMV
jgi:hypothetical protein